MTVMPDTTALVVIKPDALLEDRLDRLTTILTGLDLRPIHYVIRTMSESDLLRQYDGLFSYGFDLWSHALRAYSFGPCVWMLLEGSPPRGTSLQAHLDHHKGKALPSECPKESIRGQLGISGRTLNGIHVPDPHHAHAEVAHVFDQVLVEQLFAHGSEPRREVSFERLKQDISCARINETHGLWAKRVVMALVWRSTHLLLNTSIWPTDEQAPLERAHRIAEGGLSYDGDNHERDQHFEKLVQSLCAIKEHQGIGSIARSLFSAIHSIESESSKEARFAVDYVIRLALSLNVYLSEIEQHILRDHYLFRDFTA